MQNLTAKLTNNLTYRESSCAVLFLVLLALTLPFVISSCSKTQSTSSFPTPVDTVRPPVVQPANGQLTTDRVQATLSHWVNDGQVMVQGIQELGNNMAQANLTFSNFSFNYQGGRRNYSGPGVALFTHYNDGRWVMTKVSTQQGFNSIWWDNLNIPVN